MARERRPEEKWAERVIAHELGVPVREHDDGSRNGMHDLNALLPGGRIAAIEVTGAHNRDLAELMGVVDPKIECTDLRWSWNVHLLPSARYRDLQKHLPGVLGGLEQQGIDEVRSALDEQTRSLGIDWAWRNPRGLAGDVFVHVRPPARTTGGFVSGDTGPLVEWLEEFLMSEQASSKRRKLGDSDADELHIFVIVPILTGAVEHRVWHPLWEASIDLPSRPPHLPEPLTHVWIATDFGRGAGLRWSPSDGWTTFDKLIPS